MSEDKIWQSIARKLAGEASDEEQSVIDGWAGNNKNNKAVYTILSKIWDHKPLQTINTSPIYSKLLQRRSSFEQKQNFTSRFLYYALRISAVLFLLLSTTIIVNKYLAVANNEDMGCQEIYVPKGNRTSFTLPDGSKVWISNDSKIKYPNRFKKNTRELELEGEAYFEVVHENGRPFIVNVGKNRVRVLGTKFSITAYPDDDIVRAELVSGKILFDLYAGKGGTGFKSYEIKPSHSLVWDKTSGKLFDSKIMEGFYDYWQNGVYEFNDESLESLSKKIDRIYNVEVVFEDGSLKNRRFSGTISMNDNIFTFMEAIKRTSLVPFEYKYDRNKIFVKLKK